MKVCETFRSIAGESGWQGLTATFIRFSGCDVGCVWCDTRYARTEPGTEVGLEELLSICRTNGCARVILTGGEPLLQKDLAELCVRLLDEGFQVQVETSGTCPLKGLDRRVMKVVDLKPPSAKARKRFHWPNLDLLGKDDEIKFPLADRKDYDWACRIIKKCALTAKHKVLFSPVEGRLEPSELAGWLLEDNLECRLQLQLHKVLWPGNVRGK